MNHTLRFKPGGQIDGLYTEAIDLRVLGRLQVVRATVILFCEKSQQWKVRCATTGRLLHTDPSREACLAWERSNLQPQTQDCKTQDKNRWTALSDSSSSLESSSPGSCVSSPHLTNNP